MEIQENKQYKSLKEIMHLEDFSSLHGNGYSDELIDRIVEKIKQYRKPKSIVHILIHCNQDKELQQMISNATNFLDDAITNEICTSHMIRICERLYCILNGIHEIPLCKVCGKPLKNFEIARTASLHYDCCSVKCKANDPDNINKRVLSYMSRSPEEKLKTKLQTEATIERRFGNKCFMKSERFKQKKLQYIKEHGGECNVSQVKEVREKVDNTNIDRYGNRCNLANKEQQEMRKQTYIENFGFDHPMKNEEFKQCFFDTFEQNHGIRYAFHSQQSKDTTKQRLLAHKRDQIEKNLYVKPLFNIYEIDEFICSHNKQYWWQCLECGHVFASHIISFCEKDGRLTRCPFCNDKRLPNHSLQEFQLVNFLRNTFPDMQIIHNCNEINRHIIPPYELDIWIPEKHIAIEYNGVFWHSIEFIDEYYDSNELLYFRSLEKTKMCENQNIHLIHVYEDEWINRCNAIKQLLINLISEENNIDKSLDIILLPHDKYPSFINIDGYVLDHITQPQIQNRFNMKGNIYHLYDCGQLVFKRIK